jgi:hypothetical protein
VQRSGAASGWIDSAAVHRTLPDQYVGCVLPFDRVSGLSDSERAALIAELSPNPADPSLRASVLRKIADNATLKQREFNRAFVLMEYFGYLRRNPDAAPDLNFNGYNFWLNQLNQFNGNFANADMVKAFLSSGEYRQRFGP